ncbi:MAG: DNA polymerase II [Treponema sp.]|jgi:DNA polymerase-2|nr:DNA polymerase II [Treponema sp.]
MDAAHTAQQYNYSQGFLVHSFYDNRRNKIFLTGRLENGFSFAAADSKWKPYIHIFHIDEDRCKQLLASIPCNIVTSQKKSFVENTSLLKIIFQTSGERSSAAVILQNAGIVSPDMDMKIIDLYLIEKQLKGPIKIEGVPRQGRSVDLVFSDPIISPLPYSPDVRLIIASIDIETNEADQSINALSLVIKDSSFRTIFSTVLLVWKHGETLPENTHIEYHRSEVSLLKSFIKHITDNDPDVITGWNILDFDFPHLMKRFDFCKLPFLIGRSLDAAKYFPGEGRRSAAVIVSGRQVIDALRIARASPEKYDDYSLETVSRAVLGKGKLNSSKGRNKIAELTKMYHEEPITFAEYCLKDSELVLDVLEKTGLFRLTLERAQLTGVSLDKAWTSVASFERIYGIELAKRNIAPIPFESYSTRRVSGAAGGTILEPESGLFSNVAVFDFRSLYPTIMRTFNIDPWSNAGSGTCNITAPNGANFIREPGILPSLIAEYFAARKEAIQKEDTVAAYVYKILMNSFYGVLGSASCRYAKTELAGAITSFAKKWLLFSKDWFEKNGYKVLYGDTDSLFVMTHFSDDISFSDFTTHCKNLADKINHELSEKIKQEYQLDSFLELRFEKPYKRFMIPPLRSIKNASHLKGRAKGYAGFVLHEDATLNVEIKGMEAIRSDSTPLAKKLQVELLELVFRDGTEAEMRNHVINTIKQLQSGKLDTELIYQKRLRRPPESYTASTPPQVKAARALGWKGKRGKIEYYWTVKGAEPVEKHESPMDYNHYIDAQILSVAGSIALAAGWNPLMFPERGKNRQALEDGQMELW